MKQRLAFAAALLHDPRVLVVDEPMVGLDPRSVRLVKDLLRRKAREGMTVFMSTHSLFVAEEISDRIGIVDQGELKFLGTLAELRDQVAIQHLSLEDLYLQITSRAEV
jgi:ABC-2 type transport system ATP-binding protein